MLPGLVAERLGSAALLCYLICGVLIFCIGLCFAEVGSRVTVTGGTYAYIEAAFGPFAGFLTNNIFWLSACLSDAAVANGLSKTLAYFWPELDKSLRPLFYLLLFTGLAWINIRGAKSGVRWVIFTTLAKLVPLLSVLLIYLGVVLAAIKFRIKTIAGNHKSFTIPGGIAIHIIATATILWLLFTLSKTEIVAISFALTALSIVYVVINFFKQKTFVADSDA